MARIIAGATLERAPGRKYLNQLGFAELAWRGALPRLATLRQLRGELGERFTISLRAPRAALWGARGPLRLDDDAALEWTQQAAEALGARFVVFPTPAQTTSGMRDRTLLREYFARLPASPGRSWVWAPSGVWEPQQAYLQARALEVLCAFDPLQWPPPVDVSLRYARVLGLGARTRLSEDTLRRIAERLSDDQAATTYVAFDSPRSFEDACRLNALVGPAGDLEPTA